MPRLKTDFIRAAAVFVALEAIAVGLPLISDALEWKKPTEQSTVSKHETRNIISPQKKSPRF
jgi:hypothetical protein